MRALELWLIRHGETDWNRERRTQGQSGNALSALGVRQAQRLGARLAGTPFDHAYCSDLRRAVQTAEIAFPGRAFTLEPRLREISSGVFEGRTAAELSPEERQLREEIARDRLNLRPEGGESYRDVQQRLEAWLASLPASGRLLVVTHGGIVHTLLRRALGYAASWDFSVDNAGITELHLNGRTTLIVRVNDCAHLEGTPELRPARRG